MPWPVQELLLAFLTSCACVHLKSINVLSAFGCTHGMRWPVENLLIV